MNRLPEFTVLLLLLLFLTVPLIAYMPHSAQDDLDTRIESMTLEHKVGQMFMVNLFGAGLSEAGRDILQRWQPGAVLLMNSNIQTPAQITQLVNTYQETITQAGGVPLFVATDQEGGIIARLQEGFTEWPVPMLLTAANDAELAARVGAAMGTELGAVGVNMNLAPVADLQTNLNNPIIGRRSPGSDPQLVGQMIAGLIEGMRSVGVMATAKHFPGHGDSDEDSHTTLPNLTLDRPRLDAVELLPFQMAIEAETGAIMTAHIWFSALDPDTPLPASLSRNVVTGLLRNDLAYQGIIMTDAMDMDAIDTNYSPEEAAVLAVQAGIDLLAIGANAGEGIQDRAMQAIVDAVNAGEIEEARIDESVRRILSEKQRYGVLDWSPLDPATVDERLNLDAHTALVEQIFQAGVTVARDRNNVLPFDEQDSITIVYPGNRTSIWVKCREYSDSVSWMSYSDTPTAEEIASAGRLAEQVDTVVIFTRDAYFNEDLQAMVQAVPESQAFVVALISPFDLLRFPFISGYMMTYSPLDPAISTACGILFGEMTAQGVPAVDLELDAN